MSFITRWGAVVIGDPGPRGLGFAAQLFATNRYFAEICRKEEAAKIARMTNVQREAYERQKHCLAFLTATPKTIYQLEEETGIPYTQLKEYLPKLMESRNDIRRKRAGNRNRDPFLWWRVE